MQHIKVLGKLRVHAHLSAISGSMYHKRRRTVHAWLKVTIKRIVTVAFYFHKIIRFHRLENMKAWLKRIDILRFITAWTLPLLPDGGNPCIHIFTVHTPSCQCSATMARRKNLGL